ncbi:hypothetical protein D5R81_07845 [Parashewanella spongiae]|uniref:Uncharacterized protein n=1 Tax=Parashewanella spongiae TaxID=342950 RepID=A0A3A6U813_9GAMM|nr:hypothetical protein [Parashewanella spongiae]MCL1077876.1 hypothetical protein [Parashewanella spongiae]RJY17604.1 hypothetical protein D5R81_07845 [Parashewanella spongiae]
MLTAILLASGLTTTINDTHWQKTENIDGFTNLHTTEIIAKSHNGQFSLSCHNKQLKMMVTNTNHDDNFKNVSFGKVDKNPGVELVGINSQQGLTAHRSSHWTNWAGLLRQMTKGSVVRFRLLDGNNKPVVLTFNLLKGKAAIKQTLKNCNFN